MVRLGYYAGASTAAAAACLLKAFHSRPNFYSATVYLSQSNACILILTNLCLMLACSTIYGLQRLLYGPLRPIEIEQLSEKAWYAVLDTLLAMPSFREDVGGWLLTMFVLLLAGKVWGWIGEGRVDILEQGQPIAGGGSARLFHARLATSLVLSVVSDMAMLHYSVECVMADPRPGMMVIFTFEFAILSIFSTFTLSRYGLSLIQAKIEGRQMKEAIEARKQEIRAERAAARQNETADGRPAPASPPDEEPIEVDENEVDVPGWEEKRRYLFALEVFTDFIKLMIYIVFFTVSVTFNGLPMHIMRDVYMTFASFSKRVSDYVAYRKATSDMNTRYPDATTEEIRGDACIVCRESMVAWEQPPAADAGQAQPAGQQPAGAPAQQARRDEGLRAKKLPCNHILHLRCLKAWLERQQVCPTCRRPVVQATDPVAGQPGAAPGAPGAPHAALPGQPGQHGAQPQQRQNRARFFNLGPLRVGFLNGPDDQIQNIINRMRNPQAGANQDAAQAAALNGQGGPNHLGLQVPYLNGGRAAGAQQGGARAQVPTQIQMMQLEHRLMQEAHNLGIEQQQLGTLRLMEAEMARLRAQHVPAQPPVGTATAAQRQVPQVMQMPVADGLFGGLPFQQQLPMFMPAPPPQQQEVLQGNAGQQISGGQDSLPQGLVLPEGWTVMPLQRAGASGVQLHPGQQSASRGEQPPIQTTTNGSVAHASGAPSGQETAAAGSQASQQANGGPTDDRGSPLFVPTTAAPVASEAQPQSAVLNSGSAASHATTPQTPGPAQPPQQPESKAPWTAQDGWSFVNQNGDSASNGEHVDASSAEQQQPTTNGAPAEGQGYSGKGKGRAVEVEDAPEGDL